MVKLPLPLRARYVEYGFADTRTPQTSSTACTPLLPINISALPPLPELPASKRDIPFLHKSYIIALKGGTAEAHIKSEVESHKQSERIGDRVLSLFILQRLNDMYPDMDVGVQVVCFSIFRLRLDQAN